MTKNYFVIFYKLINFPQKFYKLVNSKTYNKTIAYSYLLSLYIDKPRFYYINIRILEYMSNEQ